MFWVKENNVVNIKFNGFFYYIMGFWELFKCEKIFEFLMIVKYLERNLFIWDYKFVCKFGYDIKELWKKLVVVCIW